jgi:hypothetical protein
VKNEIDFKGAEMVNVNTETDIPYGYIAAATLDPEMVERLIYGAQAIDLGYAAYVEYASEEASIAASELGLDVESPDYESWLEADVEKRLADYEPPDECSVEGSLFDVRYRSSWLGGALHFFIQSSPYVTHRGRKASPCVPGAAILDTLDGSETGYDVPPNWRNNHD